MVLHSTLYEELKDSRVAVIEALLSTLGSEGRTDGVNVHEAQHEELVEVMTTNATENKNENGNENKNKNHNIKKTQIENEFKKQKKRGRQSSVSSTPKQMENPPKIFTPIQRSAVKKASLSAIENFLNRILTAAVATFRYQLVTALVTVKEAEDEPEVETKTEGEVEAQRLKADTMQEGLDRFSTIMTDTSSLSSTATPSMMTATKTLSKVGAMGSNVLEASRQLTSLPAKLYDDVTQVCYHSQVSNTESEKSMVHSIIRESPLPLLWDGPYKDFFPLLSDPTALYLNPPRFPRSSSSSCPVTLTLSLSTTLANLNDLNPHSNPEKFLVNVFRTRFCRPSNKRKEVFSPSQSGVVFTRKLNTSEDLLVERSLCTLFDHQTAPLESYVPQVGHIM